MSALSRARVWWLAARPPTLLLSISPVLSGSALAWSLGAHRPWVALGALAVGVMMQVGVNYANDYSDFVHGVDSPNRAGPRRSTASGLIPASQIKLAAWACFTLAAVVGAVLALTSDWRLLGLGALAVLAAWLYAGGPRPYGHIGLGEAFVFVFFGLLATVGTVYVQLGRAPLAAWLIGVSMGFLACAAMALNNLRDRQTDAISGKRTVAVLLGPRWTRRLIGSFLILSLLPPVLAVAYGGSPPLAVLPLITAPLMLQIQRASSSDEPRLLVWALRRTARLEVWFAILLTLGLLLGRVTHVP
jgi:1,4-dihydroxy-2-naphthoate polyprenyltransferase